jgi:pimeloyl-ACP methyl ester carboxylesterase
VYVHGNSSDITDSINFISLLTKFVHTEYIAFDYTGYGESRVSDVGEEIICRDLEIVLAHITDKLKLKNIILWGFSLGTFPVAKIASKYGVLATILQCPIASISCLFHSSLNPDMKFKEDYFATINHVADIKGKLFIMHSSGDEIIPFAHAKVLYDKFMIKNGCENVEFIEVAKIKHNSLHRYIASPVKNELQKELFEFIIGLIFDSTKRAETTSAKNTE